MKTLNTIIQEKLKINSKSKVNSSTKNIAEYFKISEQDAEIIETKYLHAKYFNLDDKYDKDLLATRFELVFGLAAMLVDDNAKVDDIERLGTVGYKRDIGPSNPYDYSWYEEPIGNYTDVLEYIQSQYIKDEKFNKLFKEVYEFCKNVGIYDFNKIFDFYENIDIN